MFLITRTFICVLISFIPIVTVLCVKVYLERAHVVTLNPKYVTYGFINVTRYKRGGSYYVNFEFANTMPVTNNVTVTIRFFEYRWNKYYRSILEFRHKFCDFIEKDTYMGVAIGATGLKCPVKSGKHAVMNISAHFENFPNPFPFEKARVNFMFNLNNGDLAAEAAIYISVKNNDKKNKKQKRI